MMSELIDIKEKYRAILEALNRVGIGIDIVNKNYEILFQNNILKERFGASPGKYCYEKYMERNFPCEFCLINTVMETNRVGSIELEGADGRYYRLISAPLQNPDGTIDKVAEVILDMTNQKESELKLKESEEKYRMLFEGANDAIFLMKDFKFFECNRKTLEIFRVTTESNIIGLFPWDISPSSQPNGKDSKHAAMGYMNESLNGKPQRFYWKHVRKDGILIDTEVSLNRILISNEYYILAVVRDITEKLEAEKKIGESERKYRLISENANDLITVLNKNYEHEYVNEQAYFNTLGYSENELLGKRAWNYVHPDDIKRILNSRDISTVNFNDLSGFNNEELRIRHKNGQYIWLEYKSKVFNDEQGEPKAIAILRDITKRKSAEQKLKESEEKYRHIFNDSPIGIFLFDEKEILIDGNTTAFKIFTGFPIERSIGKNFTEIIRLFKNSKEILDIFMKRYKDQSEGKLLSPIEFKAFRQDGKEIWLHWQNSKIRLQYKDINQAIVIDITERKEAERLIIEENKKLQELSDIKQDLITRISHELKTPITSTYGASQALLEIHAKDMTKEVLEFVEIINRGSKRLKTLVENLFDIIKLDLRVFKLKLQEENLCEIIRDTISDLKYYANNRDININSDLPEELIMKVDKIRIGQVFTNIISNAINNTVPGGHVFIRIDKTAEYVDIIIKDTGVGITKEEGLRLFEKFGKIERFGKGNNVHIEGSGLGLYISKGFVELHGGEILVESEGRNKGATFKVRIYTKITEN